MKLTIYELCVMIGSVPYREMFTTLDAAKNRGYEIKRKCNVDRIGIGAEAGCSFSGRVLPWVANQHNAFEADGASEIYI